MSEDSTSPLLEVEGLKKSYGGRKVVDEVRLRVQPGEIVGLLGPNGAGKTTTFYMIAGLIPPDHGRVSLYGKEITRLPMHKRARQGMGYLPQEESIFRKLSVEDNLLAVLETRKKLSRKARKERANMLLERFGISHVRKSMAMALSGGEKRRLSLARCLCTEPKLLMLDEPFVGIDPIAVQEIHKIIRELRDQDGLSILITDHQVRETLDIVDRASLLVDGKVMLEGSSEELVNDERARQLYFGSDFRF
ncbi:LPS export ABC transporter ATP-binding protein [Akkermansiaceae bacterium]|jgi:lipopolysaccharide export system ATP-binding protein|nr:LPS export ABC transporter ATP-binding protein [Akkermansiaceae bacterium]MDB4518306.1 LPS export ABC transporter ATP-binding protein [Akkermansiaceae bacterium]|tara:strand:- start:102 stop:848 length:747 start_codon:yes stop_codon:yes gene_type:complete